jgi:hypothetical protein
MHDQLIIKNLMSYYRMPVVKMTSSLASVCCCEVTFEQILGNGSSSAGVDDNLTLNPVPYLIC